MFDVGKIKHIWKTNKIEMIPFALTFFFGLYESSVGIIFGIFAHVIVLLSMYANPVREKQYELYSTLKLNGNVMFPSQQVKNRYISYVGLSP